MIIHACKGPNDCAVCLRKQRDGALIAAKHSAKYKAENAALTAKYTGSQKALTMAMGELSAADAKMKGLEAMDADVREWVVAELHKSGEKIVCESFKYRFADTGLVAAFTTWDALVSQLKIERFPPALSPASVEPQEKKEAK